MELLQQAGLSFLLLIFGTILWILWYILLSSLYLIILALYNIIKWTYYYILIKIHNYKK